MESAMDFISAPRSNAFVMANQTYPGLITHVDSGKQWYHIPYDYGVLLGPEKIWHDSGLVHEWAFFLIINYWSLTVYVSIAYAIAIHAIQWAMKDREPFDLKWFLIAWNSCHAFFSLIGFFRVGEEFFYVLRNHGLLDSIAYCTAPFSPATLWSGVFAASKIVELGDTIFVVLRKKPLIFLHWYHHAVVLVYVWHAVQEGVAGGRWFIFMNFGVHTLMYAYFALAAAGIRLPRVVSMVLTSLQTTQMFVGVAISFIVFYFKLQGHLMQQSFENLFFCFGIYVSFAVLFSDYFTKSYLTEKNTKTKSKNTTTYPAIIAVPSHTLYYIPYQYGTLLPIEDWWSGLDRNLLEWALNLVDSYWWLTIWIGLVYSVGIHVIQRYMLNREAYTLKWPLIVWNTGLALFSLGGTIRMGEEFFHVLRNRSWLDSITYTPDPFQPAAFWGVLFGISKARVFELGDTVFVVLRKKPLIFLHWYHHASVLVLVWHAGKEAAAACRWFAFMNFAVHTLMYTYYASSAAGYRFPRSVAKILTTMQTIQMFIGVAITFIVFYCKLDGRIVQHSYENLYFCFAVYVSFAYLFSDFFSKSYGEKGKKSKAE